MYAKTTHSIEVIVKPLYLEEQSRPDEGHFVWAYQVRIENKGRSTVQLLNRYWRIVDAVGRIHEVRGAGVVGERPVLEPGQAFEYTSGTPLQTPSGFMAGSYEMEGDEGHRFEVEIPAFSLDSPHEAAQLH